MAQVGSSSNYPTKQEVLLAITDADYILRRFEEVTDKIDFGRWNATTGLSDSARSGLDAERRSIRELKPVIEQIRNSPTITADQILEVYRTVGEVRWLAVLLGSNVATFARDDNLSTELIGVGTKSNETVGELDLVLERQVLAEEIELLRCRFPKP